MPHLVEQIFACGIPARLPGVTLRSGSSASPLCLYVAVWARAIPPRTQATANTAADFKAECMASSVRICRPARMRQQDGLRSNGERGKGPTRERFRLGGTAVAVPRPEIAGHLLKNIPKEAIHQECSNNKVPDVLIRVASQPAASAFRTARDRFRLP